MISVKFSSLAWIECVSVTETATGPANALHVLRKNKNSRLQLSLDLNEIFSGILARQEVLSVYFVDVYILLCVSEHVVAVSIEDNEIKSSRLLRYRYVGNETDKIGKIVRVDFTSDCFYFLTTDKHIMSCSMDVVYKAISKNLDSICLIELAQQNTTDYLDNVSPFSSFNPVEVSCGKEHVLIRTLIGQVFSFGRGTRCQLGHGSTNSFTFPTLIEALEPIQVVKVCAGGWHSLALTDTDDVYIWGWNESGQLGFPLPKSDVTTVRLHGESTILSNSKIQVTAGPSTTNSRKIGTSVITCGDIASFFDISPQIFSPKFTPVASFESICSCDVQKFSCNAQDQESVNFLSTPCPVNLPEDSKVTDISAGSLHSLLLLECGHVLTTGSNSYGQLCLDDNIDRFSFTLVKDIFPVLKMFGMGWNSFLYLKK